MQDGVCIFFVGFRSHWLFHPSVIIMLGRAKPSLAYRLGRGSSPLRNPPLCSEFTAQKRRRPEGRFAGPVHLFCQQNTRRSKLHIACSDFFKSQSALIALLLLSKSNPLRWASIWFWAQSRKKIDFTHLLHDKLTDRQGVGLSIFIYRMQKLVAPQ